MYTDLKTYQQAVIIHDFTVEFVKKYIDRKSRTRDQMEQAARSGKQNIVEGSSVSKTSPKNELFLLGVARGSLKELLEDYQDFARQKGLRVWEMSDPSAQAMRRLAYKTDRSDRTDRTYRTDKSDRSDRTYTAYTSYKSYTTYEPCLGDPEQAANAMITLINQTTYLLDQQIKAIRKQMDEKGIDLETQSQKIKRTMSEAQKQEKDFWEQQKKDGTIRLINGRLVSIDRFSIEDLDDLDLDETWMSREEIERMMRDKTDKRDETNTSV